MTPADFYLTCFLVGLLLSVASFFLGAGRLHLPHALGHVATPHASGSGPMRHGASVQPVNFLTITAFLAWFGGTGYLLTQYTALVVLLSVSVAVAAGLAGAAIVFWFFARILVAEDENLDPRDYQMVGVLGRISSPVGPGGTGEMIFSRHGATRSSPARSEDGIGIPHSTEVVVTRFEDGIAYVRKWEDFGA